MGQSWSRIVNTTIANYIREEEVNILRNRKLLALLKSKGRISFNWSGDGMDWKVRYRRVRMTGYADGDTQNFARQDRWKTAKLDWRGYVAQDSMTKQEMLRNRGTEAIINVYSSIAKYLLEDMEDQFGEEFYKNGYDPLNSKGMFGIESFMSAAVNPGNGGASPTGSFAGLSCVPGAYNGAWNGGAKYNANLNFGWPNGKGDAQFDFWSPVIVDYGDALFDPTTHTWAHNCVEALSYAIIKTHKNKSTKGRIDLFLIDEDMYRSYIEEFRSKERVLVQRAAVESPLIALGFMDTINQDGVDVTWEYGLPPGVGYGFNCDEMEVRSQQAQLFVPEGPDYDIASKSHRFSIDFMGNSVWNPKFFAKLINLTNPADV